MIGDVEHHDHNPERAREADRRLRAHLIAAGIIVPHDGADTRDIAPGSPVLTLDGPAHRRA